MTYQLTSCDPLRDRDEILALWGTSFAGAPSERLLWMYADHPAGRPLCWLARSEDGAAVGFAAVIPREFSYNGQTMRGGITADFCVAEGHRGFGPALMLHRAMVTDAFRSGYDFLYGLPNKYSAPVQRRIGFREVGNLREYTCLLRFRRKLAERTAPIFARLAAPVVDTTWRAALALRALGAARVPIRTAVSASFEPALDRLHADLLQRGAFLGRRDALFLNWRFAASPHAKHEVFHVTDRKDGCCLGYVVFHTSEGRVNIDDVLCQPDRSDVVLRSFVRMHRRSGVEAISVSCLASARFGQSLRANGFLLRSHADAPLYVLPNPDSHAASVAMDPSAWWMYAADNDV